MTGLVRRPTWAPSQHPYAFDVPTFTLRRPGDATIEALWAGRKRGRTTLTRGTLTLFNLQVAFCTFTDALEHADMRYGGNWHHQWDGTTLLVEPTHPLTPTATAEASRTLDDVLVDLPNVPGGNWDGWYYRREPR